MNFSRWLRVIAATLLAVLVIGATAAPASAAPVMVVMDGSRSASLPIGGTSKLDIARQSIAAALANAPADFEIGIAAYGHTQSDTCSDYAVLAPPGTAADALAAAQRVRPVGRSPIADAAVAAAGAFGDAAATGTIVVITDNADNCAADPCATISALHDEMPNVSISVLGIGIPADEVGLISCFADLTGGVYLRADDAASFAANMQSVLEAAWTAPTPELPPIPVASISVPDGVVQGQPFEVSYEGPLAAGDEIRISWYGTSPGEHIVGALVHADGSPVMLTAPVERGAYELRYWHAERQTVIASARLLVGPLPPTLSAADTVQAGGPVAVTWQAEVTGGETVQLAEGFAPIEQPLASVPIRRTANTVTLTAPARPGTYELRLVLPPQPATDGAAAGNDDDRVVARRSIEVVAANATLNPRRPIVAGSRFAVDWTGPGGADDAIELARPDMAPGDALSAETPVGTSVSLTAPFPPGPYELRYWSASLASVVATTRITVTAPTATITVPAQVPGGSTFDVTWTGPGALVDRLAIVAAGAADDAAPAETFGVSMFGTPITIDAPVVPGQYEIRYLAGEEHFLLARQTFDVTAPDVTLSVPRETEAGQSFAVAWTGPGGRYDEVRIVAVDGSTVAASRLGEDGTVQLMAPAATGTYTVTYWAGAAGTAIGSTPLTVVCGGCQQTTVTAPTGTPGGP